eukprot:6191465-Pleurochrysis_carterae.AAC.1
MGRTSPTSRVRTRSSALPDSGSWQTSPTLTAETDTAAPELGTPVSAPPSPGSSPRATPAPLPRSSGPSSSPSPCSGTSPAC